MLLRSLGASVLFTFSAFADVQITVEREKLSTPYCYYTMDYASGKVVIQAQFGPAEFFFSPEERSSCVFLANKLVLTPKNPSDTVTFTVDDNLQYIKDLATNFQDLTQIAII